MNGHDEIEMRESVNCDYVVRAHQLCLDLYNIMMLIHSGMDVDRILHQIVEESCKAFCCESAQIALREGDKWVIRYASRLPETLLGRSFTEEEFPHAAIAMLTKKPLAIVDAFADERANVALMKELGIRSVLVLPLLEKETVIGSLIFGYHSATVTLTDAEVDYAEKIAAGVAIALQNVRLAREAEESKTLGYALNAIDTLLYNMHDYDAAMAEMLEIATEAIGAESAVIFSREESGWRVSFVYKLSPALIGRRFSNSAVLHTAITALTKRSLVVPDALDSNDVDPKFIEMLGIRSLLDFPLIVKGDVIGDLTFHYHTGPGLFKESHIEFVQKLQNSITLALENARLLGLARLNESRMREAEKLGRFGYFHIDCSTGRMTWSEGLFLIFGRDPARGEPVIEEIAASYSFEPGLEEIRGVVEKEGRYEFDARVMRGGSLLHASVALQSSRDEDGRVLEVFGTLQDMTERKLAAEELRQKEQMLIQQNRMAAMGEMLGNIAHQWRQPLNVLGLTVQEIGLSYDLEQFTKELLDKNINKAMEIIQHMSRSIDDFRDFTLPEKEKSMFSVNEVAAKAVSVLEEGFRELGIAIETDASGDPQVNGYPSQYAQVLFNLLMNARDAFVERGVRNARVTVRSRLEKGRAVVTVGDNAGGIEEEIAGRIFDPFFTTKEQGKGTGLGLFIAKTIIEKTMGGALTVRNVGGGAEFRLEL